MYHLKGALVLTAIGFPANIVYYSPGAPNEVPAENPPRRYLDVTAIHDEMVVVFPKQKCLVLWFRLVYIYIIYVADI